MIGLNEKLRSCKMLGLSKEKQRHKKYNFIKQKQNPCTLNL